MNLKLRLKYGLAPEEPTDRQVRLWSARVRELIRAGVPHEEAGHRAAREIFRTYQQYKYASQADTVYDILAQLDED